jgi:hypothetical protein
MMTQALSQIGYHLVKEFISVNTKRNLKKDIEVSFLKMEKMHEIFARQGIEEW